jgi:hypothetical protein
MNIEEMPAQEIPPDQLLELHVLGGRKGESTVIRLPRDSHGKVRWGVVDCYSRNLADPTANPTVRFLQQAGVSELEFLCLTHPHDDHYRGMSHLLEHFTVRRFWQFNFPYMLMGKLVNVIIKTARGREDEEERSSANDLLKTLQLVRQKQCKRDMLMSGQELYAFDGSTSLSIRALSPSGDQVEAFTRRLERWCGDAEKRSIPPKWNANEISAALQLRYGSTQIVLGGDAEKTNWLHALRRFGPQNGMSAQAVKVSHHGSCNGYCDGLWQSFCDCPKEQGTYALIAPYCSQDLPTKQAIDHIRLHTPQLYATCMPAIPYPEWDDSPRNRARRWETVGHVSRQELHQVAFWGFEYLADDLQQSGGTVSICFDDRGNAYGPRLTGQAGNLVV